MKYSLERLGSLVHSLLRMSGSPNGLTGRKEREEWKAEAERERENVKGYLLHKSLGVGDEQKFSLLIHLYQAEIVHLMDLLYARISQRTDTSYSRLLKAVLGDLEDILAVLRSRFTAYFDTRSKVPAIDSTRFQCDTKNTITQLRLEYGNYLSESPLLALVFDLLEERTHKDEVLTYERVRYLQELQGEIKGLFVNDKAALDNRLVETVINMNVNHPWVYHFLVGKVAQELEEAASENNRGEIVARWFKTINQFPEIKERGLYPETDSLKEDVTAWILQELFYLETKQKLGNGHPSQPLVPQEAPTEKIQFSTSVEVMTLLARAAKDARLITNKHTTDLFRILAKHSRTTHTENPSAHSMLKKSYVAGRSSKQEAIDFLHEMIKHIHGY